MGGIGTGKKSLLVFLVLVMNVVMLWFGIEIASRWWYGLLIGDVICAGWMAYNVVRSAYIWVKGKLAGRADHKVKRVNYRRMAM